MRAETGGAAGIRKRILGVLDLGEGGQGGGCRLDSSAAAV